MNVENNSGRLVYISGTEDQWAPIYDATVNHIFLPGKKRAFEVLALQRAGRILIVGVATGADFAYLPDGVDVMGIDLSPEMLSRARLKLNQCLADVTLIQGDAQNLLVKPASFDAVVLNLILSVIPDGRACVEAAIQARKPGGRIVIFDKFLPEAPYDARPAQFSYDRIAFCVIYQLLGG